MKCEVICIGTEILLGTTINTNLSYVGLQLDEIGHTVEREVCIPDTPDAIGESLHAALTRADVVITIGGLGPTIDDMTREIIAEKLGMQLEFRQDIADHIRSYFGQRNIEMPESVLKQAYLPDGAEVIPNDFGTAPGLWCDRVHDSPVAGGNRRFVVMLPGPPREFNPMFSNYVMPRIRELFPPAVRRVHLGVSGIGESSIETLVDQTLTRFAELDVAYCVRRDKVDVRLTAPLSNDQQLEIAADQVRDALAPYLVDPEHGIVGSVCQAVRDQGWTLGIAESCTGGEIARRITDIAGVSDVFKGSFVTYANAVKIELLGVSSETINTHGAVSAETAHEMVRGLSERLQVDTGIAVTGIAGPSGGTADKPVGRAFIGTIVDGDSRVQRYDHPGDRKRMRDRTTLSALNQLLRHIQAKTK
jgi:nicotinamide-nucleotide amidase